VSAWLDHRYPGLLTEAAAPLKPFVDGRRMPFEPYPFGGRLADKAVR
jgi:hypothetical protein